MSAGRKTLPTIAADTRSRIERAARAAERNVLRRPFAEIFPLLNEGYLDVEIYLEIGANGGLRRIEIGAPADIANPVAMTVNVPVHNLARDRMAPLLVAAIVEVLEEVRAERAQAEQVAEAA